MSGTSSPLLRAFYILILVGDNGNRVASDPVPEVVGMATIPGVFPVISFPL